MAKKKEREENEEVKGDKEEREIEMERQQENTQGVTEKLLPEEEEDDLFDD